MPNLVPIFDEKSGFIGIWAAAEDFTPTLGRVAELGGLAEPTLMALTKAAVTRTLNRGSSKVGKVTFEDGVFIMRAGEKSPLQEVKAGKSFRAFSYQGIPCAQRVDAPVEGYSREVKPAAPPPDAGELPPPAETAQAGKATGAGARPADTSENTSSKKALATSTRFLAPDQSALPKKPAVTPASRDGGTPRQAASSLVKPVLGMSIRVKRLIIAVALFVAVFAFMAIRMSAGLNKGTESEAGLDVFQTLILVAAIGYLIGAIIGKRNDKDKA